MRSVLGVLRVLLIVVVALAVVAGVFLGYTFTRAVPQTSGTLRVAGLTGPVEVLRDAHGIPHIYADTETDLFLAQGYVHAQDRFYQMDFWRHQTAGRLSELYGSGVVGTDQFLRTIGWRRVAEQEYASAGPDTKAVLDAYAAGVNAYIGSRAPADLSLEYTLLGITGPKNYQPEPWSAVDTLAWGKAMAWDLGGNLDDEIQRADLLQQIGAEKTAEYMPAYPHDFHPVIVPDPALGAVDFGALRARVRGVQDQIGGYFEGIGSNDWVIAGSRTTTGMPLLADDPHLSIQMPSIWYQVGLHCRTLSAACPYDVVGYSFAGVPAVIIGHNARIAWGVTNTGPDVQDLFIEKLNPNNPNQYEVNGQWVDMQVLEETITVTGRIKPDPEEPNKDLGVYDAAANTSQVKVTVRYTRHGPLITDVYGLEDFARQTGAALEAGQTYGVALRWTALEPGTLFQSVFKINRAQNWDAFRIALRDWDTPSQNFVYADVDGNIGYQMPGNIPLRQSGDGTLPVPGWTDAYEWTGYIPFDQLPYSYNPPAGFIATANNAVVGPEYPYLLSTNWDPGYRAARIVELLQAKPQISMDDIAQIHGDNENLGARDILPYLTALEFDEPGLRAAVAQLRGWDRQMHMDSAPAALYAAFLKALVDGTFRDDLPEAYWPGSGPGSWQTLRTLLAQPQSDWWDDQGTAAVETRDDILRRALADGYAALEAQLGEPDDWSWGRLHGATFTNATLGRSGIGLVEALFNRGPFPASGGSGIVNATGYNSNRDAAGQNPYALTSVPSMRMIVDLANLENTRMIHTTGQSGHAFSPHYIDLADAWRLIEYNPMPFGRAAVDAAAQTRLTLIP